MQAFEKMLKEGTPSALYEERKIRYRLADACLESYASGNQNGREIYSALSHLAQIPELEINMAHYDNMLFMEQVLDKKVYYRAKAKLHELKELMEGTL